jgi:hypothetical protein
MTTTTPRRKPASTTPVVASVKKVKPATTAAVAVKPAAKVAAKVAVAAKPAVAAKVAAKPAAKVAAKPAATKAKTAPVANIEAGSLIDAFTTMFLIRAAESGTLVVPPMPDERLFGKKRQALASAVEDTFNILMGLATEVVGYDGEAYDPSVVQTFTTFTKSKDGEKSLGMGGPTLVGYFHQVAIRWGTKLNGEATKGFSKVNDIYFILPNEPLSGHKTWFWSAGTGSGPGNLGIGNILFPIYASLNEDGRAKENADVLSKLAFRGTVTELLPFLRQDVPISNADQVANGTLTIEGDFRTGVSEKGKFYTMFTVTDVEGVQHSLYIGGEEFQTLAQSTVRPSSLKLLKDGTSIKHKKQVFQLSSGKSWGHLRDLAVGETYDVIGARKIKDNYKGLIWELSVIVGGEVLDIPTNPELDIVTADLVRTHGEPEGWMTQDTPAQLKIISQETLATTRVVKETGETVFNVKVKANLLVHPSLVDEEEEDEWGFMMPGLEAPAAPAAKKAPAAAPAAKKAAPAPEPEEPEEEEEVEEVEAEADAEYSFDPEEEVEEEEAEAEEDEDADLMLDEPGEEEEEESDDEEPAPTTEAAEVYVDPETGFYVDADDNYVTSDGYPSAEAILADPVTLANLGIEFEVELEDL